jgi:tetratricopeptide (TPR) repeat protein
MPRVAKANTRIPRPVKRELKRAALLKRMNAAEFHLCVLAAPSGFGKTTLMAQYARQTSAAVAWVALDEDVYDVKSLGRAIIETVQHGIPEFAPERWTQAVADGYGNLRQASALAADLNDLGRAVCLVVDQGQLLSGVMLSWLERFTERVEDGVQVLLACFRLPGAEHFGVTKLAGTLILRDDDLEFSKQERQLLVGRSGKAAAEGTPAYPLAFAVQSLTDVNFDPAELFTTKFRASDLDTQQAMLELSFFHVWDRAHLEDSAFLLNQQRLEAMLQHGFPIRIAGEAHIPHDLLLNFLQARVKALPPAQRNPLLERTAQELVNRKAVFEALRCYQLSERFDLAHPLLETFVMQRFGETDYHSARRALELFELEKLPLALRVRHAQALLESGDATKGVRRLEELYATFSDDPLTAFAYALLQQRLANHSEALSVLSRFVPERLELHLQARVVLTRSESLLEVGRSKEAIKPLLETLPLSESLSAVHYGWNQELLGVAFAKIGEVQDSVKYFAESLDYYQNHNLRTRCVACFARILEVFSFTNVESKRAMLEQILASYEELDILQAHFLFLLGTASNLSKERRAKLNELKNSLQIEFSNSNQTALDFSSEQLIFEKLEYVLETKSTLSIIEGSHLKVLLNNRLFKPKLKKSLEVLLYIVFSKNPTQKEILTDVFSSKRETATNNFKAALSNLRADARKLGFVDELIRHENGRYMISPLLKLEVQRDPATEPASTLKFVQTHFDSDWINERYIARL